ncbi:MAG: GNAT family N-acetyltransferase [Planctomycetes bacterium]|nr:GNAT family N-acetyltransferase [Planctomycetota bacterium]MBU4398507.1 GNAT family N-acetyltransferase [Planctomycetota bacterium]MCG2685331.1 GNAT family N-acetyltransferase [Planctomycetales bacterium]
MNGVCFPAGSRLERLRREHPRRKFHCGVEEVDRWLSAKAMQHQEKHLSATKALVDKDGAIAGYYTLATGQVDFGDLPAEAAKRLPRRSLPVAVLAWLGISSERQGQGLGRLLLAQALRDCWEAGKTFAFVAVILDCINDDAKRFYQRWDFAEVPGRPYRLFLSTKRLAAMMGEEAGAS